MMHSGFQLTDVDDEYEKLVIRMNPPRVTVDNNTSRTATLIKVDSANKHGSLLEVVQVLTDLNLTITRAYISSDGEWFMDVFYVVDPNGKKLSDDDVTGRIEQSLGERARGLRSVRRSVGVVQAAGAAEHTTIELTGRDRPGLLSEVFAVLAHHRCNVVAAEVWTHNTRMASVLYINDGTTGAPLGGDEDDDPDRLAGIKQLLRGVLRGGRHHRDRDRRSPRTAVAASGRLTTHTERRLHQMMYADRDYVRDAALGGEQQQQQPQPVTVEDCADKGYSVVTVRCRDRPKLLFDTVCTLTDMEYVVFHATVFAEGPEAHQEYYIRHMDGCPVSSEGERQRLVHCLEAAIRRRNSEGIRLELCCEDRVGLLSDVTRIFRENGLSVARAEVATRGSKAVNTFYVTDASGGAVQSQTIEAVRAAIGQSILRVKDEVYPKASPTAPAPESGRLSSLGSLVRSRSEKFLYNLGLIKSCS